MMVVMEVVEHLLVGPGRAGGSKGQFNIDDVGYANASDVNMNVAGLNSSLYDSSQTWSSFGASGTYSSTYDWTKMFFLMSNARTIPANGQSITADFSSLSGGGIAYTSSFKFTTTETQVLLT